MYFFSGEFLLFFAILFLLYFTIFKNSIKAQNILLLIACYFFYGYANWKMLPLLVICTSIFYFLGLQIKKCKSERNKSRLSSIGIVIGVGILFYFKYMNFFIESFTNLFKELGICNLDYNSINIIIPVGISFFVFRLISYTIEVQWESIEPSNNFIIFANYIAFFPCILSGPIDRPDFMEQFKKKKTFNYSLAADGVYQFIWGLFKKLVVADNCAIYVETVWNEIYTSNGSTLLLALVLYAFQLYADFSGYSDMAIGVGKLLGFRICRNFNYPFFAINIADFWRRWHISLTSWVTDYVFMPLNLSMRNLKKFGTIIAIIINLLIVGMWHEANWTCVFYGLYHGILFIPLILSESYNKPLVIKTGYLGLPNPKYLCKICLTFCLVLVGFLIFRADNIQNLISYGKQMFNLSIFSLPFIYVGTKRTLFFVVFLIIAEWLNRNKEHPLHFSPNSKVWVRISICYILVLCILEFAASSQSFIYFKF